MEHKILQTVEVCHTFQLPKILFEYLHKINNLMEQLAKQLVADLMNYEELEYLRLFHQKIPINLALLVDYMKMKKNLTL